MCFLLDDNLELAKVASKREEWYELIKQKNAFICDEKKEVDTSLLAKNDSIERLTKENDLYQQRLKESEEKTGTLQFENDELSIKLEKYERLLKEHESALGDSENFVQQLNEQIADLKNASEKENIGKEVDPEKCVEIKTELVKAEDKVKEYGEKIIRLEKQMHCYESMAVSKTPKSMKSMTTPVLRRNRTPTSPYSPSSKSKVNPQQVIKKLEKLLDETSKTLEKKSATVVTKTNKIQQLEVQIKEYEKKTNMKELLSQKNDLQENICTLKKQIRELSHENEKLKFNFENEEENCASLQHELNIWTKKVEMCEAKLTTVLTDLSTEENKKVELVKSHERILKQLNQKVAELTESATNMQEKIELLKSEKQSLQHTNEDLSNQQHELKEKMTNVEKLLASSTKELETLQKDCNEKHELIQVSFSMGLNFNNPVML